MGILIIVIICCVIFSIMLDAKTARDEIAHYKNLNDIRAARYDRKDIK